MPPIATLTLVADRLTPVAAYASLRKAVDGPSFLLESVVGGERWGRYSVLGYRPKKQIVLSASGRGDPFSRLAELLPGGAPPEQDLAARFASSHVGYLSYDMVHFTTKVKPWPHHEPLARLLGESTVVVFDNLKQTMTVAATSREDVERACHDLQQGEKLSHLSVPDPMALPSGLETLIDDERYEQIVRRAQEYIRQGDVFQVVPARTLSTPMGGADPFDVYRALRVLSPSPYMYFLDFPKTDGAEALQIAGASPETLVRLEDEILTVRPIAGTRRRGRTPADDLAMEQELLADPKERAEHIMLIDLARNDVGRVASSGTVRIPSRFQIERFSHVMHITSEVTGKLRSDLVPWDVLRSAFPAGTLTGAPKVRAMQIIRELEARPRGIYGGAIGYIGAGRQLDFAIAIRTIVCRAGQFEVTAGGGIVEGSVPALEAKETRNKARAALSAIRAVRGY